MVIFGLVDLENCKIQNLDAFGAQIESMSIDAHQLTLNLSKYPKGHSSIKLETNKKTFLKTLELK